MYTLYILRCKDNYLYTGITSNLVKRLIEHRTGLNKLTKNRNPIELVYKEDFTTRIQAAKREKEIKGWRRKKKEELITKNQFTLRSETTNCKFTLRSETTNCKFTLRSETTK